MVVAVAAAVVMVVAAMAVASQSLLRPRPPINITIRPLILANRSIRMAKRVGHDAIGMTRLRRNGIKTQFKWRLARVAAHFVLVVAIGGMFTMRWDPSSSPMGVVVVGLVPLEGQAQDWLQQGGLRQM